MRRYPSAVIYASKAIFQDDRPILSTAVIEANEKEIKEPIFRGFMQPDITFFGFDINQNDMKGKKLSEDIWDTTNSDNAGWFFVIQEQPSEPRFGFNEKTVLKGGQLSSWDNLGWDYPVGLISDSNKYVDLYRKAELKGKNIGGVVWGSHAPAMANITLQKPVRIAIHASEMLPK